MYPTNVQEVDFINTMEKMVKQVNMVNDYLNNNEDIAVSILNYLTKLFLAPVKLTTNCQVQINIHLHDCHLPMGFYGLWLYLRVGVLSFQSLSSKHLHC